MNLTRTRRGVQHHAAHYGKRNNNDPSAPLFAQVLHARNTKNREKTRCSTRERTCKTQRLATPLLLVKKSPTTAATSPKDNGRPPCVPLPLYSPIHRRKRVFPMNTVFIRAQKVKIMQACSFFSPLEPEGERFALWGRKPVLL